MTSAPDFSIILPTFNRDQMLIRAVKSILAQTLKNFEIIIVDDASDDNTCSAAGQFSDPRIRYSRHTRNLGAAAARNTGIRLAKGKYISFLDDDDEFLPGFLNATFTRLVRSPESVGFTWTGLHVVEDTPYGEKVLFQKQWQPPPHDRKDRYKTFLKSMHIGAGWGLTIRRACFDRIGFFNTSFTVGEDTELILRLCEKYDSVSISEYLVKTHAHSGAHLHPDRVQTARIYEKILFTHYVKICHDVKLLSYFHYKTGWWYYFSGNRLKGRRHLKKAIQAAPLDIKNWMVFSYLELTGAGGIRFQRFLTDCFHNLFIHPRDRAGLSKSDVF